MVLASFGQSRGNSNGETRFHFFFQFNSDFLRYLTSVTESSIPKLFYFDFASFGNKINVKYTGNAVKLSWK